MQRLMDDYISNGKIKPRELFVTHRIALDQIDKVYYSMREHNEKDKIIKVRPPRPHLVEEGSTDPLASSRRPSSRPSSVARRRRVPLA